MSQEFKEIKNDLKEIDDLMKKVSENWHKLDDEDFYRLSQKYPDYLPSFDELESDFNCWIKSLLNNDN